MQFSRGVYYGHPAEPIDRLYDPGRGGQRQRGPEFGRKEGNVRVARHVINIPVLGNQRSQRTKEKFCCKTCGSLEWRSPNMHRFRNETRLELLCLRLRQGIFDKEKDFEGRPISSTTGHHEK